VPELITGGMGDPADRGDAEPRVTAALNAFAAGRGSEHAVLTAIASTRLLVPVVPVLAEEAAPAGEQPRREKVSEMAMPTLAGHDGRSAVMAFTCLASLARWRADARPVPVPAAGVWQAAATETGAVIIDVAGPVPFAVDGARLAALAAGRPAPLPHQDADVRAAAAAALAAEPVIAAYQLLPGKDGSDLTVELTLVAGCGPGHARAQEAIQRSAERIIAGGGASVRRGIAVSASAGGPPEDGGP
jgi:SseB protein N-terminal domain